jgi:hypothetical protein
MAYYTSSRRVALPDGSTRTVVCVCEPGTPRSEARPIASLLPEAWPASGLPRPWVVSEWIRGAFNLEGEHAAQACDEARDASREAQTARIREETRVACMTSVNTRGRAARILAMAAESAFSDNLGQIDHMHLNIAFTAERDEALRATARMKNPHAQTRALGEYDAIRALLASVGFSF